VRFGAHCLYLWATAADEYDDDRCAASQLAQLTQIDSGFANTIDNSRLNLYPTVDPLLITEWQRIQSQISLRLPDVVLLATAALGTVELGGHAVLAVGAFQADDAVGTTFTRPVNWFYPPTIRMLPECFLILGFKSPMFMRASSGRLCTRRM